MGMRAGAQARDTGVPAPCPFDRSATADLHAAWSTAYVAAAYRRG